MTTQTENELEEGTTTQTLRFQIHGDFLTNLVRNLWTENDVNAAKNIIEASGCPEDEWINILTGKKKMEGVNTLHLESDDATESSHEIPLDLNSTIIRLEKEYEQVQIRLNMAQIRMGYWPLRMDFQGVQYKHKKFDGVAGGFTARGDERLIKKMMMEIVRLSPLFDWLYPMIGKSIMDFDADKITESIDYEESLCDFDHPQMLNNMRDAARTSKGLEGINVKTIFDMEHKISELQQIVDEGIKEKIIELPAPEKISLGENRMIANPWPDIEYNCRVEDLNAKEVIPVNLGEGISFIENGDLYEARENKRPRELTLNIRSYIGISPEAVHYYGKLETYSTNFSKNGDDSNHSSSSFPRILRGITIEVTQRLTEKEKKRDPQRWDTYRVGDMMNAYNSEAQLIKRAKQVFKKHFGEGWKLIIG